MPYPQGRSAQEDLLKAFRAGVASRYRIEREVGRGGMATVYLAQDLKHHRTVALKVFRSDLAAALGPGRFQQEIDVAARLNHPNILPLYDSDEAAGNLFYVMPFVEGGTLRDRLARDSPPTVAEAIGVVRQIAAGLAHAHAQGLVHRDIKPGNILLSSGHAFLADFGIAWVVREAVDTERLTGTGLVLGTPYYMAPEQLAVGGRVDQRADQYALGCVLYEMLLGHPPEREFRSTAAARRSILAARHDLPPEVAGGLARALSPDPAGRFPDIAEFAAAIDVSVAGGPRPSGSLIVRGRRVPRWVLYGLLALLPVALVAYALATGRRILAPGPVRVEADTSRYAILPAETTGEAAQSLNAGARLHDAFDRWDGIRLADGFQVREAMDRKGKAGPMTVAVGRNITKEVRAGRFVLTTVVPVGDSLRVAASLYDLPSDSMLFQKVVMVASSGAGADAEFNRLADLLLFRGVLPDSEPRSLGSQSFPARQAFFRGQEALQRWNLAAADSAFERASNLDEGYAAADLWLALVRAWSGQAPARWQYKAQQALARKTSLSGRDQELAQAIAEQGRGQMGQACDRWLRLARLEPNDFVGWYGTAFCLKSDSVVVPDPASPTRVAFRANYNTALYAYRQAFQLLPSILATFQSGDFSLIRDLFYTSENFVRPGRLPGQDRMSYVAYPSWAGDSLAFVPYPLADFSEGRVPRQTLRTAVRKERQQFRDVALTWAAAAPRSAEAQEVLALSLELLDDHAAVDTLRHARSLATDPRTERRIVGTIAGLMLKYSIPNDTIGMRRGVALADSLLRHRPPGHGDEPAVMGYLAALLGRADLAADVAADLSARENSNIPSVVLRPASRLVVFASLGGPLDTLAGLQARTLQAMDQVGSNARDDIRGCCLLRAATLAFSSLVTSLMELSSTGDELLLAQLAFRRGDTLEVRRRLDRIQQMREGGSPEVFTFDRLYPEAHLLAAIGDAPRAAAWVDPSLGLIAVASPSARLDPAQAGSLARAMALRAQLAVRLNDPANARRWGEAVALLWQHADPFLQAAADSMKRLGAGK